LPAPHAQMVAMAERIVTFEEAFKKIKEATGVADVNEVIQKFMTQEDTHNNLKQITTESQTRLDLLHAERATITQQLELLKYSGSRTDGSRSAVDDYEVSVGSPPHGCWEAMKKLRIVTLGVGTGRQKMVLERGANPTLSRRTCSPRYGLQSGRGESAGVAKRPRERSPTRNPYVSQLFEACCGTGLGSASAGFG
jgi:hypothetical protein